MWYLLECPQQVAFCALVASIMPFFRSCNELQLGTAALVISGIRMRLDKSNRVEDNQVPSIRTFRQFSALFVCL